MTSEPTPPQDPRSQQLAAAQQLAEALAETQNMLLREEGVLDADQAMQRVASCHLHPLACGRRRIAVAIGPDWIAKVAWKSSGVSDNRVESRLWETAGDELRGLLCPVDRLLPGDVLIMRRCQPIEADSIPGLSSLVIDLSKHGIGDAVHNIGLLDDRVVAYDYAMLSAQRTAQLLGRRTGPSPRFS